MEERSGGEKHKESELVPASGGGGGGEEDDTADPHSCLHSFGGVSDSIIGGDAVEHGGRATSCDSFDSLLGLLFSTGVARIDWFDCA